MTEIVELSEWLTAQPEFTTKKRMLVFTDIIHVPSGEKVIEGFRYFRADVDELLAAFDTGDLSTVQQLEFALDEDGDPDTSSVCLLLAYTAGGAFLAAQPQEYRDYVPTALREPRYITTGDPRALAASLDQSA